MYYLLIPGVKRSRLNMFIAGFLVKLNVIGPSNFLLLSDNIGYIEQHPKFARFHQILLDRGFFVVLAHPQTLISQETEPDKSAIDPDQTGSEMSAYFQSVRLWKHVRIMILQDIATLFLAFLTCMHFYDIIFN